MRIKAIVLKKVELRYQNKSFKHAISGNFGQLSFCCKKKNAMIDRRKLFASTEKLVGTLFQKRKR